MNTRGLRLAALLLALSVSGVAQAGIVMDLDFEHLALGATGNGQFLADTSGNNYHAFSGGGVGNTGVAIAGATPGSVAIDWTGVTGSAIQRLSRTYTGHGVAGIADPTTSAAVHPTIGATESWTIEAMARINQGSTATSSIVSANRGTNLPEWWIRVESSGIVRFLAEDEGPPQAQSLLASTDTYNDGEWHHFAVVFDRDDTTPTTVDVSLYVDNLLVDSGTVTDMDVVGSPTDGDIEVGAFDGTTARALDGAVDRVVISDTTLAPASFLIPTPSAFSAGILMLGGMLLRRKR